MERNFTTFKSENEEMNYLLRQLQEGINELKAFLKREKANQEAEEAAKHDSSTPAHPTPAPAAVIVPAAPAPEE